VDRHIRRRAQLKIVRFLSENTETVIFAHKSTINPTKTTTKIKY